MIPHPTIPRFYIIENYLAFQEIFMVNSLPKPDFTNINQTPVSVDETPKVSQKGLAVVPDESSDEI